MVDDTAAPRSSTGLGALDNTDRILLGACVALWLGALGAAVAATVALVELGRGDPPVDEGGTPWLLYTVIAVSAVVIVAAVPLLLRARRAAQDDVRRTPGGVATAASGTGSPGDRPRPHGPGAPTVRRTGDTAAAVGPQRRAAQAVADRLWLRCGLEIGCAMGASTILIGAATYLMAVDNNAAAWACYGVAAVITVAMPLIPWRHLREVRELVGDDRTA